MDTTLIVLLLVLAAILASGTFVVGKRRRRPSRTGVESPSADSVEAASARGEAPEDEPPRKEEAAPDPAGAVRDAEPIGEAASDATVARPRLRDRLGKARGLFAAFVSSARSTDRVDETTWNDLEEALILADVGAELTSSILGGLKARAKVDGLVDTGSLMAALRSDLVALLVGDRILHRSPEGTNVWLFVGVNGVGKTTTIGKIGLLETSAGTSVVLAAGDTFRAAAADQLALWADRVGAEVIRGAEGGDPGAVVFDAVQHAAARNVDLVLADTAGRLHNKVNLMEELRKIRRVASRPPGVVSEVLLVIDATTGQNGLVQAKKFAEAVEVTGVVLTKLDGTAKGGIAVAIQAELGIPIKLVGIGEGASDLIAFDPEEFVGALLDES